MSLKKEVRDDMGADQVAGEDLRERMKLRSSHARFVTSASRQMRRA
jgi:hypothetical protein